MLIRWADVKQWGSKDERAGGKSANKNKTGRMTKNVGGHTQNATLCGRGMRHRWHEARRAHALAHLAPSCRHVAYCKSGDEQPETWRGRDGMMAGRDRSVDSARRSTLVRREDRGILKAAEEASCMSQQLSWMLSGGMPCLLERLCTDCRGRADATGQATHTVSGNETHKTVTMTIACRAALQYLPLMASGIRHLCARLTLTSADARWRGRLMVACTQFQMAVKGRMLLSRAACCARM